MDTKPDFEGWMTIEGLKAGDQRHPLKQPFVQRATYPTCRWSNDKYLGWFWIFNGIHRGRILNTQDIRIEIGWEDLALTALVNDF